MENEIINLDLPLFRGKFQDCPIKSYPGRMYGCYDWDAKTNNWIKNKNHPDIRKGTSNARSSEGQSC